MDAHGLLTQVAKQSEMVRSQGFALLKLLETVESCDDTEQGSSQEEVMQRRRERMVGSFEKQEKRSRAVLENLYMNICEFDKREMVAMSGGANGTVTQSSATAAFYEDETASRTIAIKGVARDVAHSMQSEMAWRATAYENAVQMNEYFHDKLALLFPKAPAQILNRRKLAHGGTDKVKTKKKAIAAQQQTDMSNLQWTLESLKPHGLRKYQMHFASGENNGTLRSLVCEWKNCLNSVIEFTPVEKGSTVKGPVTSPLDGIRITWVEIIPRTVNDTQQREKPCTLARNLTVAAQQQQYQFSIKFGEKNGLFELLRWLAAELALLDQVPVQSDFASPLHLAVS